ncbi:hypothetical protein OG588_49330 [Streptomyces prunicolor]|uniref:hypothetical protein n=1 Tax=Streptomyces prunicolor TaxID=67348 RepID=UPI00386F93AA|nr:hypothetical protein OG588_00095 [Streptomyces prunicolor]WSV18281.1 hypothetical protein OG588_49330 [Streptomyces prunicolor]
MNDRHGPQITGDAVPGASPLTSDDVSELVPLLLAEVKRAFASSRWALINSSTERVKWLVYAGAALSHCCRLLAEMERAGRADQEMAVRLLGRAHLEAWVVCLYIQFGEYPALERLGQAELRHLNGLQQEADAIDAMLAADRKEARRRRKKVEKANTGIARWNAANPAEVAKPLRELPHVPQLKPIGIDLSEAIAEFGSLMAQELTVSEMVDTLTKWGPTHGFATESFRTLYFYYRLLSGLGTHATMTVLDQYVPTRPSDSFVRVRAAPSLGTAADQLRCTALYATAYATGYVLSAQGCDTPIADRIEATLYPDPAGRSAWSPGTKSV